MLDRSQLLILLNTIFATALVTANVLAGKVVAFGDNFVIPAAVVTYAFTFLITDIIHEKYGKEQARRTIIFGFIAQVFASIMILIGYYLPVAPFAPEQQEAYETLLGQNWRFVIASMAAYLASQFLDVYVFSKLKKLTNSRFKWLRNNVSTASSQFVDTTIFITIAFAGVVPELWIMIVSQYLIKLAIAVIDTPIFYLLTRKDRQ
ncbi:queuosine precursor transporter [Halalkalibacillus halophilus]|uniref:queuosine precursor transporter n=1 Tax=Halalkalibacillus halophilus TaxID=392827 RepID=UPI0004039FA4|nr:queuosine precursor transporter [Halalkalibacillus halophilus]